MIWTTWRQHRLEALAGLATLAAMAALIAVADQRQDLAHGNSTGLSSAVLLALIVLPALAGVFIGAPLLARDLELGIHRLLWTQGTTRPHWLMGKLSLVIAPVAAAAALLGMYFALVIHGQHLVFAGRPFDTSDPFTWFDGQGPAFAAYVVFAVTLGIAAGAVVGRTYPAMALTFVAYIAVRLPIVLYARPNYLPPFRERLTVFATVSLPDPNAWMPQGPVYQDAASGRVLSFQEAADRIGGGDSALAAHGIVGWAFYQPGDRFWLFQGIEAAIFVALAALLVGLTYYWVTRRVT